VTFTRRAGKTAPVKKGRRQKGCRKAEKEGEENRKTSKNATKIT
jgi:hypothetical protein